MGQSQPYANKKEDHSDYKNKDVYRPDNLNRDSEHSVLIVTADKTEDLEFFYPYYRFIEAGFRVDVAMPKGGEFKGKQGLGLKETKKIADVSADDYDLLYIPGGKAPAELKNNVEVLELTRNFVHQHKLIAAICHGPQILAAANVIDGRKIAAWPEVKDEVVAAGALYIDRDTVIDSQFITARWPGDLPTHLHGIFEMLEHGMKWGEHAKRPSQPHA